MSESERIVVPSGAIAAAMASIEALHGREAGPRDGFNAELAEAFQAWGHETMTSAFGLLIGVAVDQLKPAEGEADLVHMLVPAVVTRLQATAMPEVPERTLPTVSAVVTAAALGQEPHAWRLSMGPLTRSDGLVFAYVLWLLVDLLDELYGPGTFGAGIAEALHRDEPEDAR